MEKLLEAKSKGKQRLQKDEIAVDREFRELQGSHTVKNQIKKAVNNSYKGISKDKDKSDYSVVEKVIDQKTERLFGKWEKNGVISKINGCISAGKEANVYHATAPDGKELAIKIYKVETMVFRDREEYIEGEHRFRRGYQRTNPIKLIKVWAEKEYRNLKRIRAAGIFCPVPLIIKENLIVMEFVGQNAKAAPRLKDVRMTQKQHSQVYLDMIDLVKTLWAKCNLVHGDLSPYNMLLEGDRLIMIDVSQSVGDDHPLALEFLKRDLRNLNHYYGQHGVQTFHLRDLFEYVRDKKLQAKEEKDSRLGSMMANSLKYRESEDDEQAFLMTNMPASLAEIPPEKLEQTLAMFKGDWNLVARAFGLTMAIDKDKVDEKDADEGQDGDEEEDGDEEGEEEEEEEDSESEEVADSLVITVEDVKKHKVEGQDGEEEDDMPEIVDDEIVNVKAIPIEATFQGALRYMDESLVQIEELVPEEEEEKKARVDPFEGMTKQERKKKVKEENRVKRQNKMPKKEKKRLLKKSKH